MVKQIPAQVIAGRYKSVWTALGKVNVKYSLKLKKHKEIIKNFRKLIFLDMLLNLAKGDWMTKNSMVLPFTGSLHWYNSLFKEMEEEEFIEMKRTSTYAYVKITKDGKGFLQGNEANLRELLKADSKEEVAELIEKLAQPVVIEGKPTEIVPAPS